MSIPIIRLAAFSVLSASLSAGSFLLIRITNNFLLSLFLRSRHICHIPRLLSVEYCNGLDTNWTEGSLLFIHTVPYLVLLFGGIFIPHFLRMKNWLFNLIITWLCLHMVMLFTGGLVSGLFEYKGLGIPLEWFFVNTSLRIIGVIILTIIIGYSSRRYGWYFLKCVSNPSILNDTEPMKKWLISILVIPLLISGILIGSFSPMELLLSNLLAFITGLLYVPFIMSTVTKVYLSYNG